MNELFVIRTMEIPLEPRRDVRQLTIALKMARFCHLRIIPTFTKYPNKTEVKYRLFS